MAKPPAFQFYAVDFLMGTLHMTSAQVGAYIRLLAQSWDKGPVPLAPQDRAQWLFVAKGDPHTADELWAGIAHKWKKTRLGYINERLEATREKYAAYIAMQTAKGRRSGEVRSKKTRAKPGRSNHGSTTVQFGSPNGSTGAHSGHPKNTPPATLRAPSRTRAPKNPQKPSEKHENVDTEPRFNRGSTEAEPTPNSLIFKLEDQDQTQDQDHAFGVPSLSVEPVENRPKPSHQHLVRVCHDVIAADPDEQNPAEVGERLKSAAAKLGLPYDSGAIARAVAAAMIQARIQRGASRPEKAPPAFRSLAQWVAEKRQG